MTSKKKEPEENVEEKGYISGTVSPCHKSGLHRESIQVNLTAAQSGLGRQVQDTIATVICCWVCFRPFRPFKPVKNKIATLKQSEWVHMLSVNDRIPFIFSKTARGLVPLGFENVPTPSEESKAKLPYPDHDEEREQNQEPPDDFEDEVEIT